MSTKEQQLLYIMPELAFTVVLAESVKADYFTLKSFHQINGSFLDEQNLLVENLQKLFARIEEGNYDLVLPDYLFTDTIVSVPEKEDIEIAKYLRDELLPKIEVSTFTHDTRTSVLLTRGKTSKVQLSAFEKELGAKLKLAIGERKIAIREIIPLSWTLKAAVTLEPSVTIAQVGDHLYLAEHFVGINQTENATLSDEKKLLETIKTLKGAEPNLQTVYFLSDEAVEKSLSKSLNGVMPVQQLVEKGDDSGQIPAYLRQIIEVAGRTLSLSEFVVPRFSLEMLEASGAVAAVAGAAVVEEVIEEKVEEKLEEKIAEKEEEVVEEVVETVAELEEEEPEKVEPAAVKTETLQALAENIEEEKVKEIESLKMTDDKEDDLRSVLTTESAAVAVGAVGAGAAVSATAPVAAAAPAPMSEPVVPAAEVKEVPKVSEVAPEKNPLENGENKSEKGAALSYNTPERSLANVEEKNTDIKVSAQNQAADLSFFRNEERPVAGMGVAGAGAAGTGPAVAAGVTMGVKPAPGPAKNAIETNKKIKQKKGGMGQFFKKFFLFLLIFVITIALGIGVGLLILRLTGNDFADSNALPTPEPTVLPTPEPVVMPVDSSPSAQASDSADASDVDEEELDLSTMSILVVNATGIAGYAGEVQTALEVEDFAAVDAGNASGTYEESGNFVLMSEKNSALIDILEEASGKTLTFDEDIETEDSAGDYEAVIVLNDQ